jgi:hypothetical protein
MKRWNDIAFYWVVDVALSRAESMNTLCKFTDRSFPPPLLNISKSFRKSGPWTWLQSESASRIDVFQEFSNFKRIPVFALQTCIADCSRPKVFFLRFVWRSLPLWVVRNVLLCRWMDVGIACVFRVEPVETGRLTYFCTFCFFAVAIDLIVQHAQNLLHLRNGNHQQQNRQQQLDQRYQQQQNQQERNRHNSESCFTRPHWIRKRNLHAAISRWNFFTSFLYDQFLFQSFTSLLCFYFSVFHLYFI